MSGGVFAHRPALLLRSVAGPQADRDLGADPAQRRPQVALDVVGERLQRRDVDEPDARAQLAASGPACRSPRGSWPGSCPTPSERRSARWRRPRSPPSRPPEPASAPRTTPRTSVRTGALNGPNGSDPALVFASALNPPILRSGRDCPLGRYTSQKTIALLRGSQRSFAEVAAGVDWREQMPLPRRLRDRRTEPRARISCATASGEGASAPSPPTPYGVPPANLTYANQDFLGTNPSPNSPEPSQKLQRHPGRRPRTSRRAAASISPVCV